MKELDRQLVHLDFGLAFLILYLLAGREETIVLTLFAFLIGVVVINMKILKKKVFLADQLLEMFEREGVMPGHGSLWYATGLLLLLLFLRSPVQIASGILILSVGDSIATMVGRMGKIKLFYNRKKTFEGFLAFFLSSLLTYPLLGILSLPLALACAVGETLPLRMDDNLTVPIICIIFFRALGLPPF